MFDRMRPHVRPPQGWLALAVAALMLALFPAAVLAQSGATVQTGTAGSLGTVLVGPNGLTLYTFDQDSGSTSSCYDACEDAWPPLTVTGSPSAASGIPGTLGTTERDDGSMQVTYNGRPLYYFAGDGAPGEANGQGLQGVWFVITVSATGGNGDGDGSGNGGAQPTAPAAGNAGLVATEAGGRHAALWLGLGAAITVVAIGGSGFAWNRRRA